MVGSPVVDCAAWIYNWFLDRPYLVVEEDYVEVENFAEIAKRVLHFTKMLKVIRKKSLKDKLQDPDFNPDQLDSEWKILLEEIIKQEIQNETKNSQ